jgi:hypothetical protein
MAGYTKLFGSILDSTVWQESKECRLVWITMLAMKNRAQIVEASVPGLAKRAGVTIEECEAALVRLLSPDAYSRTKDHDGRRIEVVDGGWFVLNGAKYREKMSVEELRAYKAAKAREYRARDKSKKTAAQVRAENDSRLKRYEEALAAGNQALADEIAAEGLSGGGAANGNT